MISLAPFDRRSFLFGSVSAAIVAGSNMGNCSTASGLQRYGSEPLKFVTMLGVAVSDDDLAAQDEATIIPKLFRGMTCQSAMKSRVIFADPNRYNFSPAEVALAFAARNNLHVRGHTLLWHLAMPPWLERSISTGGGASKIRSYIGDVATHFRGRIMAWDVVNEALSDSRDSSSSALKPTTITQNLGESMIFDAFRISHASDPVSKKYLNDFFFLLPDDRCRNKIWNCLRVAERALSNGVPLHGIGLQGHLNAGSLLPWKERIQFFSEIKAMGLEITVTELDVRDPRSRPSVAARDQIIADTANDFLESLAHAGIRCPVFTWGMSDRTQSKAVNGKFAVGVQRPTPLDTALHPKPLMAVLRDHLLV